MLGRKAIAGHAEAPSSRFCIAFLVRTRFPEEHRQTDPGTTFFALARRSSCKRSGPLAVSWGNGAKQG